MLTPLPILRTLPVSFEPPEPTWESSFELGRPDARQSFASQSGGVAVRHSVRGTVRGPANRETANAVVFLRDEALPKDSGFYPYVVDRMIRAGLAVVIPDRGENGTSTDAIDPAAELDACHALVEAVTAGQLDARVARSHLGLAGHGLGGDLALLAAAESADVSSSRGGAVLGVVTLGAGSTLDRGDGRPSPAFSAGVRREPARFDLERAVGGYPGRMVFVHGEEDFHVPVAEAERLYHWSEKDRSRLIVFEKVGHSFGARDPMTEMTKEVDRIGKILVDFFHGMLG